MASQVGLSPGEQLVVPGGGSRLSRSESNCQELIGPWLAASRPSVSSHRHPEGGRGLVLTVLPMPSAGPRGFSTWLGRVDSEGCHAWVLRAPGHQQENDWGSADHPVSTVHTQHMWGQRRWQTLSSSCSPPSSAAFCAYPEVFWGHQLVFFSKSTDQLKGTHGVCEHAGDGSSHLFFPHHLSLSFCVLRPGRGGRVSTMLSKMISGNLASVS